MKAQMMIAAGSLLALCSSSAFAQEAGTEAADASAKMRVTAQLEMSPTGSVSGSAMGMDLGSDDTKIAYGVSAGFDYALNKYLSVGVAPRLMLNVITDNADDGAEAAKEVDLRARLVGHLPVAPGLEAFASLTPGYSILMGDGPDASGFALGGAVGVSYDVSPKMFLAGEVGYQRAFTSQDLGIGGQKITADLDVSLLHIGVGAGTRF
jgi:opacity protein-like surface antigen